MIWHLLSRDQGLCTFQVGRGKGRGYISEHWRLLGTSLNAAFRRHADNPSNWITSE